jgi:hypothetical protein
LNFLILSPILIVNGRLLGKGNSGMDWKKLLGSITASVDEELQLRNAYLIAENRVLRQQLHGRVQLTANDRKALAELGQKLGKKVLEDLATVAKPATILAWHRALAAQKGEISEPRKSAGRPRVDKEMEDLVGRMARENRSWGYNRIVGALANLGYTISDQTVGNILKRHGIPPAPERQKTLSWREFICIHMTILGATEFFSSDAWSCIRLLVASVLSFLYIAVHNGYRAGMIFYRQRAGLWLRFLQSPAGQRDAESRSHAIQWRGLAQRMLLDGLILRPLCAACVPSAHGQPLQPSRRKAMLVSVRTASQIRAGPIGQQPRCGRVWEDSHREAA